MPLASTPGSDAFYRRSMRKGAGGDAEGEAMRANLSFQNDLRAETPPHRPYASTKRTRGGIAGAATPTEAEVDALLSRRARGSPALLRGAGLGTPTPPRPAWVDPKPATAAGGARGDAWRPVEDMPRFPVPSPAVESARAATAAEQTRTAAALEERRALRFATPTRLYGSTEVNDAASSVDGFPPTPETTRGGGGRARRDFEPPDDASPAKTPGAARTPPHRGGPGGGGATNTSRLPVFERLYRAVPEGQAPKLAGTPRAPLPRRRC